jgi:ABC-type Fe3+-hydroxamate transport system substrate-binding protein
VNACAAVLAVSLSTYAALISAPSAEPRSKSGGWQGLPLAEPVTLPDGGRALRDATDALIRLEPYERIASGSLLTDPLLLLLCSPENIVSFSGRAPLTRDAHRYAGKPSTDATHNIEQLLTLKPDLVLVNSLGERAWVERLRESGLVVFDLGPMWGVETFLHSVSALGELTGRPEAARELAAHFLTRLESVARHLPAAARRKGLYVNILGSHMYGGTRGSSYHDVLTYAGLIDVAANDFQGWPTYTPEVLLTLDPEVIVTHTGLRSSLCERGELGGLTACSPRGAVIEVDGNLVSDAGLAMLDAAELIHHAAYPKERAR